MFLKMAITPADGKGFWAMIKTHFLMMLLAVKARM